MKHSLDKQQLATSFDRLVGIISQLRHPEHGCPWDLEQDHLTLRKFMLEEAYEAVEAMGSQDSQHLIEELGDVLLQVVLNAQVLKDEGNGSIIDVIECIANKMIRRHPHVFDESFGKKSVAEIKANWQSIKAAEKPTTEGWAFASLEKSPFPALGHAVKIGKKAHRINFDWSSPEEVLQKVKEELGEVEAELETRDHSRLVDEIGDLLFSVAQLARHLGVDPELAATHGNQKFLKRFKSLESLAKSRGKAIESMTTDEMESLWQEVKTRSNQ